MKMLGPAAATIASESQRGATNAVTGASLMAVAALQLAPASRETSSARSVAAYSVPEVRCDGVSIVTDLAGICPFVHSSLPFGRRKNIESTTSELPLV